MSYCRTSSPDSDVYVVGNSEGLECYVAWREADLLGIDEVFTVRRDTGHAEKAMIGHLLWLRSIGIRVPEKAIKRLTEEAGEKPLSFYEKYRNEKLRDSEFRETYFAALESFRMNQARFEVLEMAEEARFGEEE